MSSVEYSYTLIKYRHDVAAGEVLNVGVVMYAPETGQIAYALNSRYARLSEAFAGFDGDLYRATIRRLEAALEDFAQRFTGGLFQELEREKFSDVGAIMRAIWPDQGMALFANPARFGITNDLERDRRQLYDRFVQSQQDGRDPQSRYNDDAVWSRLKQYLSPRGITSALQFKVLGPSGVEFDHAYKNDKWHAIEPLSFDYASPSDIKSRAYEALGKAAAVREVEDFGSLTLVVARPRRLDGEKPYHEAMRVLKDLPVPHRIVQEEDMEKYAAELEAELRTHGALKSANDLERQKPTEGAA